MNKRLIMVERPFAQARQILESKGLRIHRWEYNSYAPASEENPDYIPGYILWLDEENGEKALSLLRDEGMSCRFV